MVVVAWDRLKLCIAESNLLMDMDPCLMLCSHPWQYLAGSSSRCLHGIGYTFELAVAEAVFAADCVNRKLADLLQVWNSCNAYQLGGTHALNKFADC